MKFPNKYLRNLKPYKLASHKIWTVEPDKRQEILKLDWNEATIPPSPNVKKRLVELLNEPEIFNLYPTTRNEELLALLSKYVEVPTDNLQYFASSDSLHEYICKVFISVGDPVMILGPSYDNFRLTCQANGADVYFSVLDDNFTFNPARFEDDIRTHEPAMVYICNPNNPTGTIHSCQYIEHLLNEFKDTLFLIDEAYYEFTGVTCKDLVMKYDNILISRTMSKAFALANFRIGYLIASNDNIDFISRIRNPKNLTTFAQEAAIAALKDVDYMKKYVEQVIAGKKLFIAEMDKLKNIFTVNNGGGNFMLIKFKDIQSKMDLYNHLVDNNIFVRNTTHHPILESCFRITAGTPSQMERVIKVITAFYQQKNSHSQFL